MACIISQKPITTYKEGQEQLKAKAQQESKERTKQINARRQAQILTIITQNTEEELEEEFVEPFTLSLQILEANLKVWTTELSLIQEQIAMLCPMRHGRNWENLN